MKKVISNRIKITRTGKMLRRKGGQSHFKAKKTSTQLRRINTMTKVPRSIRRKVQNRPGAL